MKILIACAKIMTDNVPRGLNLATEPQFQLQANENAVRMASYSPRMLMDKLHVNGDIATINWNRYQHFFDSDAARLPAMFAYDGMVFKKLAPESFSIEDLQYANSHLFIASFLYGLLRPLDLIKEYRMEGDVVLSENGGKNMFDYWKPLLTDYFIEQIKADDGILINLASDEMKSLFDWKRVVREVTVITPEFRCMKNGRLKTIVIYTKMCRGAMTRFILKHRLGSPVELETFEYEGFRCDSGSGNYQFNLL